MKAKAAGAQHFFFFFLKNKAPVLLGMISDIYIYCLVLKVVSVRRLGALVENFL